MIDADLVEAIVQLPVDVFYGAGIPACILLLNRAKPETLNIATTPCFVEADSRSG